MFLPPFNTRQRCNSTSTGAGLRRRLLLFSSAVSSDSRTVRYTHPVCSSATKQAVRWRMLRRNPCEEVELPRRVTREMRALTPEEAARFLEAAAKDRWAALFRMALTTGLRPSEYLGLRRADVDLERGILSVQRSLTWKSYEEGGLVLQ